MQVIEITEAICITITNILVICLYIAMRRNFNKSRRRKGGKICNYLLLNQALTDLYIAVYSWYDIALGDLNEQGRASNELLLIKYGMLEYSFTLSLGRFIFTNSLVLIVLPCFS